MKTQKGITLVALVITIIVMMILVGVSVTVALNGGLFSTAQQAVADTETERDKELALSDGRVKVNGVWYDKMEDYVANKPSENQSENSTEGGSGNEGTGGEEIPDDVTLVSLETDCVGYYVDLGGEEGPEGVIYIDIANTEDGSWNGYSYTIPEVEGEFKEYYISSEEDYEGAFGTAPVISLVEGTTGTESRFYVMALENATTAEYNTFYWYKNAYTNGISEYAELTSTGVGEGAENTRKMLEVWDVEGTPTYGAKDARDMWGLVEEGWYIPSKDEWSAFGAAFNVSSDSAAEGYYGNLGLGFFYWSSSLYSSKHAWIADFFDGGYMDYYNIELDFYKRLGKTY